MANKVSYAKMNLKVNTDVNTFKFGDNEIEVLKYLPFEDKYSLINIVLQESEDNGIYDEMKMDMFFHLFLVYMYTNISFTEKQKENPFKIYDSLMSNGFMDIFLAAMEPVEYNHLLTMLDNSAENLMEYGTRTGSVIKNLITDLPQNAEAAAKIIDNFDPEKYKSVIDFAKAANGNRPIKN